MINNAGWTLVEIASRLLGSEEREAVLGDIFESNERAWQGLYSVLSLVVRKQALVWMSPKPWSAGLVVYGSSYLLMYVTISVCCTYQRLFLHRTFAWHMPTGNEGFFLLSCHVFLMLAWSWSAGFVVGSISRQTVWASGVLCAVPILSLASIPTRTSSQTGGDLVLSPRHSWIETWTASKQSQTVSVGSTGSRRHGIDGCGMDQRSVMES